MNNIKGKGSVGIAIAFFSLKGMVSIPLEPCDYNLIFDDGISINRVKVISCSYKTSYGVYTANIRSMTATATKTTKMFDKNSCEYVFIVTDELQIYNIPAIDINSGRQISLNVYEQYKVNFFS